MKKKSVLVFGLVLVTLLSFGSGMVIGQTSDDLPRVTTACETKAGLIHGFGDGFSILKKCPKGSRTVNLGLPQVTNTGSTGGDLNAGDVAFTSYDSDRNFVYVLDKDGKGWFLQINEMQLFERNVAFDLPTGVLMTDVVSWNQGAFILKSGKVYVNTGEGGWVLTDFKTE